MSRYRNLRLTDDELGIVRSIVSITLDSETYDVFPTRSLKRIRDKIDRARGDLAPPAAVVCPNCESSRHAKCCRRCGAIIRPRRQAKSDFCTQSCAREEARVNELSAQMEADYVEEQS